MTTTPTNNAVPSELPPDLKFNAGKIDEFVTSDSEYYIDRLGVKHLTISGINDMANKVIKEIGYITKDSFEDGSTLSAPNECLRWKSNGEYYRWDGTLPKVVPPGSTPESTGGVGKGAWVSVGDGALRTELAKTNSGVIVGGQTASVIAKNTIDTKHTERDSDVYDIVIAYGQSNALGSAALSGDVSEYPAPLERSLMFDPSDGTIKPITQNMLSTAGENSSGHAWCAYANEWYRQSGHGCIVINAARGATSIQQLSKGNGTGAGDFYGLLVSAVNSCIARMNAQGYTLGKKYVIWHQGETDQLNGTTFDTYRGLLISMVDNLVVDAGISKFGICVVGCPVNRPEYNWSTIQNAQRYIAAGRETAVIAFDGCASFSVRDGMIGTEGVHYTQKGYNTMGYLAAINMWQLTGDAVKTRSSKDFDQYNNNPGAPWMRAKRISAVAFYRSENSRWEVKNKGNLDAVFRPVNIIDVAPSSDNTSILFRISDRASLWTDFSAEVNIVGNSRGLTASAERVNIDTEFYIKVTFYQDITFGVRTTTGALYSGRPLASIAGDAYMQGLLSATSNGTIATIIHGGTRFQPMATHYGDASFSDSSPSISVRSDSATQTSVKCSNGGNNPLVVINIQRVMITPQQLQNLSGFSVQITGVYAPEF